MYLFQLIIGKIQLLNKRTGINCETDRRLEVVPVICYQYFLPSSEVFDRRCLIQTPTTTVTVEPALTDHNWINQLSSFCKIRAMP